MALVIISDGKIYRGDPVAAAQRMKDRYGDRLCIYTAQVGDLPFGRKLLQRIAEVGGCGYYVTSDDLVPDANMDQWVDDIFNRRRGFRPGPRYVERDVGPCPDADGDGVCDDQDACPGTPRGAKVDARGCWDIGKVQFVIDRYNVRPQYYPIIDEVVRVMKLNPGLKIKVQGHTCTIASEKYNMKLSYNRAISVSDYMLKQGINSNRISVEGFGFHRPTATNQTEEGRELNRRVEFEPVK
jgi:OOP family OmpA-OmpF porin